MRDGETKGEKIVKLEIRREIETEVASMLRLAVEAREEGRLGGRYSHLYEKDAAEYERRANLLSGTFLSR